MEHERDARRARERAQRAEYALLRLADEFPARLPQLELGVERTALWCGDGRPCDAGAFGDALIGETGETPDDVPASGLTGLHARWAPAADRWPFAVSLQRAVRDAAAGATPRQTMHVAGIEHWGQLSEHWGEWSEQWSCRLHAEATDTRCSFAEDASSADCAYNHAIYQTGYRYRGRAIGHSIEQNAQAFSAGLVAINARQHQWWLTQRAAELNGSGVEDLRNTLATPPQDFASLDVSHGRETRWGRFLVGIALERFEDPATGDSQNDAGGFFRWPRNF